VHTPDVREEWVRTESSGRDGGYILLRCPAVKVLFQATHLPLFFDTSGFLPSQKRGSPFLAFVKGEEEEEEGRRRRPGIRVSPPLLLLRIRCLKGRGWGVSCSSG